MDGDVHLHSRSAILRRLFFYFILINVGLVAIPPIHGGTDDDPGVVEIVCDINLPASHQVTPVERPPVNTDAIVTLRPGRGKPAKPIVEVKIRYRTIIQRAGLRHGVESAMIKAIIMAESSYNPRAVSRRGAVGLMQLMPATADSMGVKDRFDPEHNIDGGVRYFKKLLVRFEGDPRLALAAYNAGAKKVRRYNGIPPYKTTRSYIDKVFQYYQRYKDLENDGLNTV